MLTGFVSREIERLVHRLISGRHTVGFKRVCLLGAREQHIRNDAGEPFLADPEGRWRFGRF